MFEGALAGEHHGHLWVCLIAGLDGLKVTHGTACLEDGGCSLVDSHIGTVSEREKGVGDHDGTRQVCPIFLDLSVYGLFLGFVSRPLGDLQAEIGIRDLMGVETEDIRIFDIGLMDGNFRYADSILLAGPDSHRTAIFDVEN